MTIAATGNGKPSATGLKDVGNIHAFWRAVLILLGAGLIYVGLAWWASPKEHTAFAPSATSKSETAKVSEVSETLSGLLIGLGVASILVGINGRKLTSIKAGDVEVAFQEAASTSAAAKARKKAKDKGLSDEKAAIAETIAGNEAFVQARAQPLG
jgi:hypothetical protein